MQKVSTSNPRIQINHPVLLLHLINFLAHQRYILFSVQQVLELKSRNYFHIFFLQFWKIFITTLLASSSEDKVKMR